MNEILVPPESVSCTRRGTSTTVWEPLL